MKKVLCAGEINVDLVLQGYTEFPVPGKEVLVQDFALVLGSATAIMAMGLARLGTPVAFVGRVGDDVWGRYCLDDMASRGIDLSRVIRGGGLKTGVTVSITHPARPRPRHLPGRDQRPDRRGRARRRRWPASTTSTRRPSSSRRACARTSPTSSPARAAPGLTTSLDTGFDPSERWDGGLRATLRETDLFFPNEVELAAITGTRRPRRRACAGSRTGARASWPSWGETGP